MRHRERPVRVDRHTAHAIAVGRIKQFRLPVGPNGPTRTTPRKGRRLDIKTLSGSLSCQVDILDVRRARHADTLDPDSLRELTGDPNPVTWARAWLLEHDAAWLARRCPPGLRGYSSLDDATVALDGLSDGSVTARFESRWADRSVWAVRFEVVQDAPVWLSQNGAQRYVKLPDGRWASDEEDTEMEAHGYTMRPSRALLDAGEVLDPGSLAPRWADGAAERRHEARSPREQARELTRQLRRAS